MNCLNCDMGGFACDAEGHFCVLSHSNSDCVATSPLENVPVVFYCGHMKPDLQSGIPKARGAVTNAVGRYDRISRHADPDGWDMEEDLPTLRTEVSIERPRSMISYNRSPDLPFDRSINPYRGCEHGCVYCFARPTHAYLGLSPGLDFETRLVARPIAPELLQAELARKSYRVATIAIGTNTDPYQPIEGEYGIMRACLEVLEACDHPVAVVTKGTLIERDIDILARMAAKGLARVGLSVTTLDTGLSRAMEPRVPTPKRRLETIRRLAAAGIPVRVMASPMVPALTDPELEAILDAGAKRVPTVPAGLCCVCRRKFRRSGRNGLPCITLIVPTASWPACERCMVAKNTTPDGVIECAAKAPMPRLLHIGSKWPSIVWG